MTDLGLTIAPRSDQLNSDDLISGPLTIKITKVSANPDSAEQPISIYFENDAGKPYKPGKSMRRVLVHVWGRDGNTYPGRSLTLYRDDKVLFGGLAVGGIRISNMSDIDKDVTMALTETRAKKKPFTVKPLKVVEPKVAPPDGNKEAPHSIAPPPGAPDEAWRACLDQVGPAMLRLRTQAMVEAFAAGPTCGDIMQHGPEWAKAELAQMLADNVARFHTVENAPESG